MTDSGKSRNHNRQPGEAKPGTYTSIHVDDRHGDSWPRPAGWKGCWTGWLTNREYNVIEAHLRFGLTNLYEIGTRMKLKDTATDRMFYTMFSAGLIDGEIYEYYVTDMAKIIFDMTDQFILELDLGEEETA